MLVFYCSRQIWRIALLMTDDINNEVTEDISKVVIEDEKALIDAELKNFNWGAAVFNFFWGIFNGTFLRCISSFMVAIVLVGVVLLTVENKFASIIVYAIYFIYIGVKGNTWSWEECQWNDIKHFAKIQNRWNWAGLIFFGLFFIIPMVSFMFMYLIAGEAIFKSISKIKIQEKDTSYETLFLSDTNFTSAANEDAIIEYLVKKKSDVSENKYTRYNRNTVLVNSALFSAENSDSQDLYTFKKDIVCKIPKKNCYIIRYKYEQGKITPVSKIYFDSVGRYKIVKVVAKD